MSESVAWPNIILLGGRLYFVGVPICLPEGLRGFDMAGRCVAVGERQARPFEACVVTSRQDQRWLRSQTPKGYWPALVEDEIIMLPRRILRNDSRKLRRTESR